MLHRSEASLQNFGAIHFSGYIHFSISIILVIGLFFVHGWPGFSWADGADLSKAEQTFDWISFAGEPPTPDKLSQETPPLAGLSDDERQRMKKDLAGAIRASAREMKRIDAGVQRQFAQIKASIPNENFFREIEANADKLASRLVDQAGKGVGTYGRTMSQVHRAEERDMNFNDELELRALKQESNGYRPMIFEYRSGVLTPDGIPIFPNTMSEAIDISFSEAANTPISTFKAWVMNPQCSPKDPNAEGHRICIISSEQAKQGQPVMDVIYPGAIYVHLDEIVAALESAYRESEEKLGPRPDWLGRGQSWKSHRRWAEAKYLTEKDRRAEMRVERKKAHFLERRMVRMAQEQSRTGVGDVVPLRFVSGNPNATTMKQHLSNRSESRTSRTFKNKAEAIEELRADAELDKQEGRYYSWAAKMDSAEHMEGSLVHRAGTEQRVTTLMPAGGPGPNTEKVKPVDAGGQGVAAGKNDNTQASIGALAQSLFSDTAPLSMENAEVHPIEQRAIQWGVPFIPYEVARRYGYDP